MSALEEEDPGRSERLMVARGLEAWVVDRVPNGEYVFTLAAVNLAADAYDGYLIQWGWPWVKEGSQFGDVDMFWLDPDAMAIWDDYSGPLRLLPLIEALLGGRPLEGLHRLMWESEEDVQAAITAAFDAIAERDLDGALYAFGDNPHDVLHRLAPDIDEVAVIRLVDFNDTTVRLNHDERIEAIRRWQKTDRSLNELARLTGWNLWRYIREMESDEEFAGA